MSTDYNPDTYVRGEMDTAPQQAAFAGFIKVSLYVSLATIALLLFLLIFRT